MRIEQPTENELGALLPAEILRQWKELVEKIESMYEMDRIWSKGFGELNGTNTKLTEQLLQFG